MAGVTTNKRDPHRDFIVRLSSELLNGEWMSAIGEKGLLYSDPSSETVAYQTPSTPSGLVSPTPTTPTSRVECNVKNSKQVYQYNRAKRECVVCRFEGRYPTEKTVFCFSHNVSLCMSVYDPPQLYEACHLTSSDLRELTCWAKFHTFYLPQGAFNRKGNIRRSCWIYNARKVLRPVPEASLRDASLLDNEDQIIAQVVEPGSALEVPFDIISDDNHPGISQHVRSLSY